METVSAFTLEVRPDNIAVITIDAPGEKMNTLKAEFASEVRGIIRQIRDNKELRGAVFISAKADNFIAGAATRIWRPSARSCAPCSPGTTKWTPMPIWLSPSTVRSPALRCSEPSRRLTQVDR